MSLFAPVLFTTALAAQPDDPTTTKATVQRESKSPVAAAGKNAAPDPELIGFLGDYEDAADGLDPIGLSEQMADGKNPPAANRKKDGHGP